jgi:DNA-binding CsgD family transcriptional regulator
VKTHMRNVFDKLGVPSRAALLARAAEKHRG